MSINLSPRWFPKPKDPLFREREGDNDERLKDAGVENGSPPSRRNVGRDIGNVKSGFFGGERGNDEDLRHDLVWKGIKDRPPLVSPDRVGLGGASFEHRRWQSVTTGVGDNSKQ